VPASSGATPKSEMMLEALGVVLHLSNAISGDPEHPTPGVQMPASDPANDVSAWLQNDVEKTLRR